MLQPNKSLVGNTFLKDGGLTKQTEKQTFAKASPHLGTNNCNLSETVIVT